MLPDNIREKIRFELESIEREIHATDSLFKKLLDREPDQIEIRAAASTLHSFYNGVENAFSAISRYIDGSFPEDERWHLSLLRLMSVSSDKRVPVISETLRKSLEKYLAFRHFYRHSYGFTLDWEQIRPLCHALKDTYSLFRKEVSAFMDM